MQLEHIYTLSRQVPLSVLEGEGTALSCCFVLQLNAKIAQISLLFA